MLIIMVSGCLLASSQHTTDTTIKGTRFKEILAEGANDREHYFVAQLYEEEWKPRLSV